MDQEMHHLQNAEDYEAVPFYIGHHEDSRNHTVTEDILQHAEDLGYDFLTARITNDTYQTRVLESTSADVQNNIKPSIAPPIPTLRPLTSSETDITPSSFSSRILHIVSPWIDLTSPVPLVANVSRQVLQQEISYASFCGASHILVQGPFRAKAPALVAQFAAAVRHALKAAPNLGVIIMLPMCPVEGAYGESDDGSAAIWPVTAANHVPYSSSEDKGDDLSIWDIWHTVRNTCKYDMRLTIALTIPKTLPPSFIQSRWASEPVRLLDLPTTTFVPNKFKVDVLTKGHQRLIARFMRQKASPWLMISGAGQLPGLLGQEDSPKLHAVPVANGTTYEEDSLAKDPVDFGRPSAAEINFATLPPHQITPHLMYLREHIQRHQPARSQLEKYGAGFQDWPQSPLQPLADNLDSVTYEVFEKDPVKYAWYECAVKTALEDFHHNKWVDGQVIVAVVGAGRGPLVQRVLQASAATGIEVDCLALEKNPSAFVHLQKRNQFEWGGRVTLIQSDMRSWVGPMDANGQKQAIDILVSELLGSLGDNELSPECLDGVQHLLHPTNGISIPSSYSAFATPVSAPELWRSIKFRTLQGQDNSKHDPLMLPYVSWLHAADYSSTEQAQNRCNGSSDLQEQDKHHDEPGPIVKKLWDFQHPSPQEHLQTDTAKMNNHNERSAHHTFQVAHRGTCHGIAGYFDAVLYDRRSLDTTVADRNDPDSTFDRPADQPWPHNPAKPVISTNPLTMPTESPDMISWFPLFFPLKTPLYVPDGGEISISIWRKTDKRGVWYEWFAEVFGPSGKCGESICHSSESAACLM